MDIWKYIDKELSEMEICAVSHNDFPQYTLSGVRTLINNLHKLYDMQEKNKNDKENIM